MNLIALAGAEIKPGSLHYASPRVRRSEREERGCARSGRDDSVVVGLRLWSDKEKEDSDLRSEFLLRW